MTSLTEYKEWANQEASPKQLRREFRALMEEVKSSNGQELSSHKAGPRLHMIATAAQKLAFEDIEAILAHPRFHDQLMPVMMSEADLPTSTRKLLMDHAHRHLKKQAQSSQAEEVGTPASQLQRVDRLVRVLSVGYKKGLSLEPPQLQYWVQEVCKAPGDEGRADFERRLANDRAKRMWSHVLSQASLSTEQLWELFNAPVLVQRNFRSTFLDAPSTDRSFWRKALTEADPPLESTSLLKGLVRKEQLVVDPVCHRALRGRVPAPSLTRMIRLLDSSNDPQVAQKLFRGTFKRLADIHPELAAGVLGSHTSLAQAVLSPSDLSHLTASDSSYAQKAAWRFLGTLKQEPSGGRESSRTP